MGAPRGQQKEFRRTAVQEIIRTLLQSPLSCQPGILPDDLLHLHCLHFPNEKQRSRHVGGLAGCHELQQQCG